MKPDIERKPNPLLLKALLDEASGQGQVLMDSLVSQTRQSLQLQMDQLRDFRERDLLAKSLSSLISQAAALVQQYPRSLRNAFLLDLNQPGASADLARADTVRFDELELMDEAQVQERIEAARGLQVAMLAAETELAELNRLVCGVIGLDQVKPDRNPFRPEIFVRTLQTVLSDTGVDVAVRTRWAQIMGPALGKSLKNVYERLNRLMEKEQVRPVAYVVARAPHVVADVTGAGGSPGEKRAVLPPAAEKLTGFREAGGNLMRGTYLTVEQLHGLLSGTQTGSEVLVQEVVNLIIANIAADERILPPVKRLVYSLEPVLMRLAKVDPRFFSDKDHPARCFLEQMAQRSFAYESVQATGFDAFMAQLNGAVEVLVQAPTPGAAPFAVALKTLEDAWAREALAQKHQRDAALRALQQVEARNRLAQDFAQRLRAQSESLWVPDEILEFACGPWAQVVAHVQLGGNVQTGDGRSPADWVADLFWSVSSEPAERDKDRLLKLIPKLVAALRQGLQAIDYPVQEADVFFEQLMALHQTSLSTSSKSFRTNRARRSARSGLVSVIPTASEESSPWLAPEEARDSGFMEDLEPSITDFAATEPMSMHELTTDVVTDKTESAGSLQMQLGAWVELWIAGAWVRAQLTWMNPQGSLFLFTGSSGAHHSMTLRVMNRLQERGGLRLISQAAVVARALDAVADQALRNSAFIGLDDVLGASERART